MATPVHAKRFLAAWNSVTMCFDKYTLDQKVGSADVTTSCDAEEAHLQGKPGFTAQGDGPADFAASGMDATVFAGLTGGAATGTIKPTQAAASATNPNYSGSMFPTSYKLDFGNDAVRASVGFQGTGALSRLTA